jgi:ABC-2 type transport system ATP-binding protein
MVVRLENVHKSYAGGFLLRRRQVLRGVDLALAPGEAYGLLGDNGAGKTTTLRILLGLTRPDAGTGSVLGAPLGARTVRQRLGYLPETPTFHEQLTAREFLAFCASLQGLPAAEARRRAAQLLERLELAGASDLRLRKMSKGMLQRLGLAQALLGGPELLVLDEPMSGLDPHGRKLVRDLILEQRAAGRTVLFSTHILSDVEIVCTRAGILRGGRIVREVRLEELSRHGAASVEVLASGLTGDAVRRLAAGGARALPAAGTAVLFTVAPGEPARRLVAGILAAGGGIESLLPRRPSLEEYFCSSGAGPAGAAAPRETGPPTSAPVDAPALSGSAVP